MGLEQLSNIGEGLKMMKELSVADLTACIHLQVGGERRCSMLRKSRQTWVLFVGVEGAGGEALIVMSTRGHKSQLPCFPKQDTV